VQTPAVLISLEEQWTEYANLELLKDIYIDISVTVQLHKSNKINVKKRIPTTGIP